MPNHTWTIKMIPRDSSDLPISHSEVKSWVKVHNLSKHFYPFYCFCLKKHHEEKHYIMKNNHKNYTTKNKCVRYCISLLLWTYKCAYQKSKHHHTMAIHIEKANKYVKRSSFKHFKSSDSSWNWSWNGRNKTIGLTNNIPRNPMWSRRDP